MYPNVTERHNLLYKKLIKNNTLNKNGSIQTSLFDKIVTNKISGFDYKNNYNSSRTILRCKT